MPKLQIICRFMTVIYVINILILILFVYETLIIKYLQRSYKTESLLFFSKKSLVLNVKVETLLIFNSSEFSQVIVALIISTKIMEKDELNKLKLNTMRK